MFKIENWLLLILSVRETILNRVTIRENLREQFVKHGR